MSILNRKVASVFKPLMEPADNKGAFGGRASGKSHFFAEQLIQDSMEYRGLPSVCIREVQKSLKHSAMRLIKQKLVDFKLGEKDGFKVFASEIETPGDGVIIFQGMQDYNSESIKSLEGFMRAWIEEGQTMSSNSLQMLRPTIRTEGSEIWTSWNPRRKLDPVNHWLRTAPPKGAIVVECNYSTNPFFTQKSEDERLYSLEHEPDDYEHVWGGGYVQVTKGAYFAKRLAEARKEHRIGAVAPDPYMTYKIFTDIGGTGQRSDNFVFVVCQFVGAQVRVVDYYEVQGQDLAAHLNWLRGNGYTKDNTEIWLPHDGKTNDRVINISYESGLESALYKVHVIANQGVGAAMQRIEAVRRLFPSIWIDETKCGGLIEALGWYHEKQDEVRQIGLGPDHDWSSHVADAVGLMAIVHKPEGKKWGDKPSHKKRKVV